MRQKLERVRFTNERGGSDIALPLNLCGHDGRNFQHGVARVLGSASESDLIGAESGCTWLRS